MNTRSIRASIAAALLVSPALLFAQEAAETMDDLFIFVMIIYYFA